MTGRDAYADGARRIGGPRTGPVALAPQVMSS